jgi:hypothetical protein
MQQAVLGALIGTEAAAHFKAGHLLLLTTSLPYMY